MPKQPMFQRRRCFALSVPASVSCHRYYFRFAKMLQNGFRYNLWEVITTTTRLNNYMLCEIETGTREQDTTEYSYRRQSVLPRCQTGADA